MANTTFRPQEQVVLSYTFYSYTAMLLKYSNFYHHITVLDTHLLLEQSTFVQFETVNLVHTVLLHALFVKNCIIQTVVLYTETPDKTPLWALNRCISSHPVFSCF